MYIHVHLVTVVTISVNPCHTCRCILTHLKQTTLENIVAKGEIDHDEQFLLWPQCVQLYLTIKLSFMEIFHVFVDMFPKASAADLMYVGKG